MNDKSVESLRNGLEDSYRYGVDDTETFEELVRKADAFQSVLYAMDVSKDVLKNPQDYMGEPTEQEAYRDFHRSIELIINSYERTD